MMKHPVHYETDEATSLRMSKVKLKHGSAEITLAKALWKEGYRYWLNYKKLPGSPDISIKKYNIAVFVDSEFWHGFDWEKRKNNLKRNQEYWIEKIEENMDRDSRNDKSLRAMGWIPIHFWEKEVKTDCETCVLSMKEIAFQQMIGQWSDQ